MVNGYRLKLEEICKTQNFRPEEVVQSDLVFPNGAVPNSQLLWVRVELKNGQRKFITLSLRDFHQFVELPSSSIGGWTDGDRGYDRTGLNTRYEVDHSGSEEEVRGGILNRPESAEETVEASVPDET
jgi:hypothetical protein